ncbi:MAG: methyl-accepting chemotaxis protein [Negativicutes bacterium]|nr:methyl-accepting chemotaxis protein [Negativicutes bacterium]
MRIRTRLFIWFVLASVIPLIIIGSFSYYLISEKISRQNEETIANINKGIYNMVDIQQKVLSLWLQSSASFLTEELGLRGASSFDYDHMVNLAGYSLPTWSIGNQKITGDFTLVDRLIEKENIGCTIFQLQGNTFIRVSTNVRKPDGSRIMNTILDPAGPVYKRLIQGLPYLGRANVEGAMWATVYQPIRDASGGMIGAFVLGRREQEYELINAIRNIVVGDTGYVFVMDPEGTLIIHPTLQGQNIAEHPWAQEILQRKNGSIVYEQDGRKKIAQYIYYEPWNWYIVTGAYQSEIFNTTRRLSESLILMLLAAVGISSLLAFVLSSSFSKPINGFVQTMRRAQSGDLSAKLDYSHDDEFKALGSAFNAMLNNFALMIGRILGSSTKLKEASQRLLIDITESERSLKGIESSIEMLRRASPQQTETLAAGNSLIHELQQTFFRLELLIERTIADKQYEDLERFNALLDRVEALTHSLSPRSHDFRYSDVDPANLPIPYGDKINSLEVEVQKLRLLLKNIGSSADSLDDIALSLDRHANVFKIDDRENF